MFKEFKITGDLTILVNEGCITHIHPKGDDMCEVFFTSGESQTVLMSLDEIRQFLDLQTMK